MYELMLITPFIILKCLQVRAVEQAKQEEEAASKLAAIEKAHAESKAESDALLAEAEKRRLDAIEFEKSRGTQKVCAFSGVCFLIS